MPYVSFGVGPFRVGQHIGGRRRPRRTAPKPAQRQADPALVLLRLYQAKHADLEEVATDQQRTAVAGWWDAYVEAVQATLTGQPVSEVHKAVIRDAPDAIERWKAWRQCAHCGAPDQVAGQPCRYCGRPNS
jgi:hypothetical protein